MTFDPYTTWLHISNSHRPPNYYELVGVAIFETDADRIHEASLARIAELRKYQAGNNSELSQRLMNEVAQARLCLLDCDRRAEYDFALRRILVGEPEVSDRQSNSTNQTLWRIATAVLMITVTGVVGLVLGTSHLWTEVANDAAYISPSPDEKSDTSSIELAARAPQTPKDGQIAAAASIPAADRARPIIQDRVQGKSPEHSGATTALNRDQLVAVSRTMQRFLAHQGAHFKRVLASLSDLRTAQPAIDPPVSSLRASGAIAEWLILGPVEPEDDERKLVEKQMQSLMTMFRRRSKTPGDGQPEPRIGNGLVWGRMAATPNEPGIYVVWTTIQIGKSTRAVLEIGNAPGPATVCVDNRAPVELWTPTRQNRSAQGKPFLLEAGTHRLAAVFRVTQFASPFDVRFLDAKTGEPIPTNVDLERVTGSP